MYFPISIGDRRRNSLSPLTGEFTERAQEQDFRNAVWPDWHRRIRVAVLAGVTAYFMTAMADYLLIGGGLLFLLVVAARLLVAGYGLSFLALAGRRRSPLFSDIGLLVFLLLLITTFLGMVSVRPDALRFSAPAAVLILCVFYAVPMARMWTTLTSALYLSVGLVAAARFFEQSPLREIGIISVQLAAVNLIGFLIARRLHQDARAAWAGRKLLERRERHQRLLAELSSQLLGVRSEQIEAAIERTFESLCDHTGSDRAYLMEFDAQRETGSMTHEWCHDGIPATKAAMQNIPSACMPWASLKLQRGEVVQADRVSDLPPEAAAERELNLAQGVQSFLCVPLSHEGSLHGMIGLDSVRHPHRWDAETVELLRFIGQAAYNALMRARAEGSLREAESQYQTLTGLSPVGIFQTNADGNCLYVNRRWTQLTGLSPQQALGDRWRSALHPDDAGRVFAAWSKAVANQVEFRDEYRFRRPDGSLLWVQCRARPQLTEGGELRGFIGAVDDITERKHAQIQLEQRAELDTFTTRLTTQFVLGNDGDLDGTIQRALGDIGHFTGADHCRLFLFDHETQTKTCLHEWSREGVEPQIRHLQNIPIAGFEWACPRVLRGEIVNVPDVALLPAEADTEGQMFTQLSMRSVLLVPVVTAGHVAGFMGLDSTTDAREWSADTILLLRITGETILNALQRQADDASRRQHIQDLEAVNLVLENRNMDLQKLAYVASHDLKEPLRTVSSFSSLLEQQYKGRLDERAAEYIAYITEASGRLHRLIGDLLAYTRVDQQLRSSTECELNKILDVVRDNLADTVRAVHANIESSPLPTVIADPLQMIQLLQHLLANALRYHGDEPPRVRISAERNGDEWVISVADNGIGIPDRHAKRVFEVFQRLHAKDREASNGIGLAVCSRIVERHGGRIWVEPNYPCGSVFRWTLPLDVSGRSAQAPGSLHAA